MVTMYGCVLNNRLLHLVWELCATHGMFHAPSRGYWSLSQPVTASYRAGDPYLALVRSRRRAEVK